MKATRIYKVSVDAPGAPHEVFLVRAASKGLALSYVRDLVLTAAVASQDDLVSLAPSVAVMTAVFPRTPCHEVTR